MGESPKVYEAICNVQAELSREGISKDRSNQQQGYKFRGIDDVYNAIAPILAKHGLCILPKYSNRNLVERQSGNNKPLFYVTVEGSFDFVSQADGSKHTVITFGEAMDSADKATNKAMSAAYKYACMQAFAIPTEGDNDADAQTPEVKPRAATPAKPKPKAAPASVAAPPPGDLGTAEKTMIEMIERIDGIAVIPYLDNWGKKHAEEIKALPPEMQAKIREAFTRRRGELRDATPGEPPHPAGSEEA